MAVSLRTSPRKGRIQNGLIIAAVVAATVAVLPIVIAVLGGAGATGAARSVFASASPGEYAVVSRTEGGTDVISIVSAKDPGAPQEVARVPHLPGYAANGSVSPNGQRLALVVADSGPQADPATALVVLDLESGAMNRVASDVDRLRTPLWTPDSRAVVTTRAATMGGAGAISVIRINADGSGEGELSRFDGALGVYPVGFDGSGRLLSVVIDGRGSTLVRDGHELANISSQITRDWSLSPDGAQLAFIESSTDGGLHYSGRVVPVDGSASTASVSAQTLGAGQQLGVAWQPSGATPTFGQEPGAAASAVGGVAAQALTTNSGFDVPIAYSPDGVTLAVNHWTGGSFADAGNASLELVSSKGRAPLAGFARFLGWAQR